MLGTYWSTPPLNLSLEEDEVHVWRVLVDTQVTQTARFWPVLSPDEQARADRFVFPIHRNRFIVTRGALRMVLARYLTHDPEQLAFRYGPYGKPALDLGADSVDLRFNVSHSHALALIAVTCSRDVGVDVERRERERAVIRIAERFFAPREVAAFQLVICRCRMPTRPKRIECFRVLDPRSCR